VKSSPNSQPRGGFVTPSGRPRIFPIVGVLVAVAFLGWTAPSAGLDPKALKEGLPRLMDSAKGLVTMPAWSQLPSIGKDLIETAEMAIVGTVLAIPVCIILSLLIARNTSFHPGVGAIFRGLLSLARAVPFFVLAMLLISMVGLGVLPGIMALIISSSVFGAKLFADSLENVALGPIEGVQAAGADFIAIRRHGILPQAFADIGSHSLYMFESNIRMSISVGIVGAGGIGYTFSNALRLVKYDEIALILLSIFLMVALVETMGRKIREKLA
jgi:phosphonate transport system permease protein